MLAALVALVALLFRPAPLPAQLGAVRVAAGAAIPTGGAGDRRDAGPSGVLTLESRSGTTLGVRLDLEWSVLRARPAPAGQERHAQYADVHSMGAALNAVLREPSEVLPAYVLAGFGLFHLQAGGQAPSPYGLTGALQVGLGVDGDIRGRVDPYVDARAMLHITDYASDEFSPTVYWPVVLGVRIR